MRVNKSDWLVVMVLAVTSRILETLVMILPVKAVFILMSPDSYSSFIQEYGVTVEGVLLCIGVALFIVFFIAKALNNIAKVKAQNLNRLSNKTGSEAEANATVKFFSAGVIICVYLIFMAVLDSANVVILMGLTLLLYAPLTAFMPRMMSTFFRLMGLVKPEARIRFASQLIFLLYFAVTLVTILYSQETVNAWVLLSVLLGRRYFQEVIRLRVGLHQWRNLDYEA